MQEVNRVLVIITSGLVDGLKPNLQILFSVCEAYAFDVPRLQIPHKLIGLSDGQIWTSGQGNLL
ncbi:MAG: hypothetical protein ABJH06_00375 [Paraglaciecola sp.]|uniref:hypothetical protein n=1 Tax=Paraglaciecola sp. TaxID=1920173 RepID=UPI0032660E19